MSPEVVRGVASSASNFEDRREFPVSGRSQQIRSQTPPGARYEDLPRERGRYEEQRHLQQRERTPDRYVESQSPYDRNYREEPSQFKVTDHFHKFRYLMYLRSQHVLLKDCCYLAIYYFTTFFSLLATE